MYENDFESAPLLQASHRSSLEIAAKEGLASVAFPAISCGIYGYPVSKAARIAVQACLDFSNDQVRVWEGRGGGEQVWRREEGLGGRGGGGAGVEKIGRACQRTLFWQKACAGLCQLSTRRLERTY